MSLIRRRGVDTERKSLGGSYLAVQFRGELPPRWGLGRDLVGYSDNGLESSWPLLLGIE